MARHRQRRGGRYTPKGTHSSDPGFGPSGWDEPDEPDLLDGIRDRLVDGDPLGVLAEISGIVAALDPRQRNPLEQADEGSHLSLDELVRTLGELDRVETSALLAGIAELAPEELVRARARRFLAGRRHDLPDWLWRLGTADVYRAVQMGHVLGDGEDVILGIRLPRSVGRGADHELSIVLYVDHNLGTVAKDGFVVSSPLDQLLTLMQGHSEVPADAVWEDLDLAEARARVTEAIDHGALMFPPLESDTWPACRPLVEWAARLLPEGGTGYVRPEWDEAGLAALAESFFTSASGRSCNDADHRTLLDSLLWFGTDYGPGDPLRWSPVAVEIFLAGWVPRKIVAPAPILAKMPELLRAWIRYAHAERGIRAALTDETLAAVDEWEPEYQQAIRTPRLQGTAAMLEATGLLDEERQRDMADELLEPSDFRELLLGVLSREVGGKDALETLDDRPLPDEAFVWEGIPDDVRGTVGAVLERCERCCAELLDPEYRTACRRLLARVATGDPQVFRRRGSADTAAAALCWAVVKGNNGFDQSVGGLHVKDLTGYFGVRGSVSQRAGTLLKAAGIAPEPGYGASDIALGSPDLLVSAFRQEIIGLRDRYGQE